MHEKLKKVEAKLASLRDARQSTRATLQAANMAYSENTDDAQDQALLTAADEARQAVETAEQNVEAIERERDQIVALLASQPGNQGDAPAPDPAADRGDRNGSQPSARDWSSARVVTAESHKTIAPFANRKVPIGSVSLGEVQPREAFAATIGRTTVGGLIQPRQIEPQLPDRPPLTFLDLLPTGQIDTDGFKYTRLSRIRGARIVLEGTTKPEATFSTSEEDGKIETLAAYVKAHRQTLADASLLRSYIDGELRYELYAGTTGLEAEVLNGDGTSGHLEGILETPGIISVEREAGQSRVNTVRHAKTLLRLANRVARVVVFNPLNFEEVQLEREDTGGDGTGAYLFGGPGVAGVPSIWGLTPVESTAIPEGKALVCDPTGAMLLIRQAPEILVSDSDGNDFIQNRITILAEMRAGLMVRRPDAFALVDLDEAV